MKLNVSYFIIFVLISLIFSSDANAIPFRELNQDLIKNCIGCKYYSILYDAISQGGYRIYTGLFNVCMFFLAVITSFQLLQSLFKVIVSDTIQLNPTMLENIDFFWKEFFKKMLRIVFVVVIVFTVKPQNITKWTIAPILNGGISIAREFVNYGIKEINGNNIENNNLIKSIQPQDSIPKINLGIIKLPLNSIESDLKQSKYCQNVKQMESDAKRHEEIDKQNNLIHSLPNYTKLNLICLIHDIGLLSKRYAGLATYYMLYTLKKNQIEQIPKTDKNANTITLNLSTKTNNQNYDFDTTFNEENNLIDKIITVLLISWLIGIGITIYNIIKWFILDPLIALAVAIIIPYLLLMVYFIFGGATIVMTLMYYASYLTFILMIPFYFIQPMFNITMILFSLPLIATAWAVGDKSYTNKAIDTIVSSSIGIAILCMVFVIAIILNELTFYSLHDGINIYLNKDSNAEITNRLQMFNLLIMGITSILGVYIVSNHSKIVKLFSGNTDNNIFGFFKEFVIMSTKKITNITKNIKKDKNANKQ